METFSFSFLSPQLQETVPFWGKGVECEHAKIGAGYGKNLETIFTILVQACESIVSLPDCLTGDCL